MGWTDSRRNGPAVNVARSLASVSGSHETYTTRPGGEAMSASSVPGRHPARGGSSTTASRPSAASSVSTSSGSRLTQLDVGRAFNVHTSVRERRRRLLDRNHAAGVRRNEDGERRDPGVGVDHGLAPGQLERFQDVLGQPLRHVSVDLEEGRRRDAEATPEQLLHVVLLSRSERHVHVLERRLQHPAPGADAVA